MRSATISATDRGSFTGYEADLIECLPGLRQTLEEQRQFRLEQLVELAAETSVAARHSASDYIEELDASANSARTEVTVVITAAARRALHDAEAALEKIRSGNYGRCEQCHGHIGVQRLVALPQAGLCMSCQRRAEVRSLRD